MANEEAKELAERQDGMEEVVKKKPRKKYFSRQVVPGTAQPGLFWS